MIRRDLLKGKEYDRKLQITDNNSLFSEIVNKELKSFFLSEISIQYKKKKGFSTSFFTTKCFIDN